jgi:hypothetical protein
MQVFVAPQNPILATAYSQRVVPIDFGSSIQNGLLLESQSSGSSE